MDTANKILVIDDDEDFTASVRSLLEREGFVVIDAPSGRDGLAMLVEHRPDAILLDIMMETDDEGYSVNEAIKYDDTYSDFRDIPIIMVSSIQESPDERFPRAPEVGMIRPDQYVRKPIDVPQLLDILSRVTHKGS